MREIGGKAGAGTVVELEDGEEGLLVADVEEPGGVEIG